MKFKNTKLVLATSLITLGSLTVGVNAATLATSFNTDTDGGGNMFDVNILSASDLLVTEIGVNLNSNITRDVLVYGRVGTHVGFQSTSPAAIAASWTLLSTTNSVASQGIDTETVVDVTDFILPASSTYALYVSVGEDIRFNLGLGVGNVAASNADLEILEGTGIDNIGSAFTTRVWSGSLTYTAVPEPSSVLLLGLGTLGAMIRRKRKA